MTTAAAGGALLFVGYLLGRLSPIRRARAWAECYMAWHSGTEDGRRAAVCRALTLALLPELTFRALWHRVRHGEWPPPAPRLPLSPVLATVHRPHRPETPMICQPCRARDHQQCPGGTWCCCQHRTTPATPDQQTTRTDGEESR